MISQKLLPIAKVLNVPNVISKVSLFCCLLINWPHLLGTSSFGDLIFWGPHPLGISSFGDLILWGISPHPLETSYFGYLILLGHYPLGLHPLGNLTSSFGEGPHPLGISSFGTSSFGDLIFWGTSSFGESHLIFHLLIWLNFYYSTIRLQRLVEETSLQWLWQSKEEWTLC